MAKRSAATRTAPQTKNPSKANPLVMDRRRYEGLIHGLLVEESSERAELVSHLFETFRKLKARKGKRNRPAEVFSSQDPSRAAPPSKTAAQIAFDRTSIQDRVALLDAFSCARESH
jgi:hypothetical protein